MADTFKQALERGCKSIPSVWIPTEIFSFSNKGHLYRARFLLLIIVSCWPLILNSFFKLTFTPLYLGYLNANIWLVSFGLIDALMLFSAFTAWNYLIDNASDIDEILTTSDNRANPIKWIDRWLSSKRQMVLPLFGALASPIVLGFVHSSVSKHLPVGLVSYLAISWTGFVGGSVLYWLWVVPGLPRQLALAGNLNLRWYDPSSTPALRTVARSLGIASIFNLMGAVSIVIFGFVLPQLLTVPSLAFVVDTFFVVSIATAVRVAIYPIIWYYRIIVTKKDEVLVQIEREIPKLSDAMRSSEWLTSSVALTLHRDVAATPDFPFSTVSMVQYTAALCGAIAALIFSLVQHG